jgi:hypothetical protein
MSQITYPSFSVQVNYDLTVEELVKAGKYSWAMLSINSNNFSSPEKDIATIDIFLVNFNRNLSSEDVVKELDRQGLRPATLKELASLGAQYPHLQYEFPIVALGSPWRDPDGALQVPFLYTVSPPFHRRLYLTMWWGTKPTYYRFAAVLK